MSEMKETEADALDLTAIYAWAAILVFGTIATVFLMAGVYERGKNSLVEESQVNVTYKEVTDLKSTQHEGLHAPASWVEKKGGPIRISIEDAKAATLKALKNN